MSSEVQTCSFCKANPAAFSSPIDPEICICEECLESAAETMQQMRATMGRRA